MPAYPLLADVIPELAQELEQLLAAQGELALAAQINELKILSRCRCGDDFCALFTLSPSL